jgi:amino acid transporter
MCWAFSESLSATLQVIGYEALSIQVKVFISFMAALMWALQNLVRIDLQGVMNNIGSSWQLLTTISVIGVLIIGNVVSGEKTATANQVFFTYYNKTGFESPLYVVFIGVLLSAFSFTGYEAVSHMAEETNDAERAIPKGIVYTGIATSVMGVGLLLGLLFVSAQNVDQIVTEGWTISDVFVKVGGKEWGIILSIMLAMNMYFSGFSSLTATSRLIYTMSRDGAFPGSRYFKKVTKKTQIPVGAVFLTMFLDWIFLSLNLFR